MVLNQVFEVINNIINTVILLLLLYQFQEIADNLEACDKVYGYRVENATCSTSKLIEDFKIMCQTEISSNVDENPKHQEFKVKINQIINNPKNVYSFYFTFFLFLEN